MLIGILILGSFWLALGIFIYFNPEKAEKPLRFAPKGLDF